MKIQIFTLLAIMSWLIPNISWSEAIKDTDLVNRNGVYYKKFTDVPFNGKVKGKLNGKLKNGREDGLFERYYDNRLLKSKGHYKNGEYADGFYESYNNNGKLKIKGYYKNGKKDGFWLKPNKKEGGFWMQYYDTGKLISKEHWKDAKLIKKIKIE